jgi:pyridoxamine 5'-phosphate oxidase
MAAINEVIQKLRSEYAQQELNEADVDNNPFQQFEKWIREAISADVIEPHAMSLATVGRDVQPSSRIVLLRDFGPKGFVFFTNYNSRKGHEILTNPHASLLFFWPQVERQVRIEGILEKVNADVSDAYFKSRPRESKLGAWVSEQSQPVKDKDILKQKFIELSEKYPGEEVPRPSYWGGYLLKPSVMEFWQGRPGRLHDRIQFSMVNRNWIMRRLSP